MILPDVNVLVYAFRSDAANHSQYRRWLEEIVNGPSVYGMSPQVLASVVRVTTHPRIFPKPDRVHDALAFVNTVQSQPHCQLIEPGPRHWAIFRGLCTQTASAGNLVQDAWYAALAIESGCEWITEDRDFARFPGLRWRPPLGP